MLLIKLGGSVISNKRRYRRFRSDTVKKIVSVLPKKDLIIIHGGGSFGHILAHDYRITDGFEEWKKMGFAKIGLDMMDLNMKILRILIKENIPAVSLPPHSYLILEESLNFDIFKNLLDYGFVPVSYGDVAFDKNKGINICSGDYLMYRLSKEFKPEKVIFLTDVDGIYDKDPDEEGAKLIKKLGKNHNPETKIKVKDVTGGMDYKIEIVKKIANYSKVYIINGFYPERLKDVIEDRNFVGTVVE